MRVISNEQNPQALIRIMLLGLMFILIGTTKEPVGALSEFCSGVLEIPSSECDALEKVYNTTNGAMWTNQTNWLATNTPCIWFGVTCTNDHVTGLSLQNNNLSGSLPSQIGNLSNLTYLDLSTNKINNNIPVEVGSLTGLTFLSVANNQLSGPIPTEVGNLVFIENLDFGYNMLESTDPTLLAYLNDKDPDWINTQTISPSNVQIITATNNSIELSWLPIAYTNDSGYYEIGSATDIAGPYTTHGITANKSVASYILTDMPPGNYFVRVRTHTPAHDTQPSDLWSQYTQPIFATVPNPAPILNSILPNQQDAGNGGFEIFLDGSNFVQNAKVLWNGIELETTINNPNHLSAAVPALLIQNPGIVNIAVRNPAPGGGNSNSLPFTVNPYVNSWMAHSPEGGVINDIDVDNNNPLIAYAATESSGVYKTIDGGQNWFAVNNGINTLSSYMSIAVAPSDSSTIVVSGGSTFITRNGGVSWSQLTPTSTSMRDCIKFDSQNSQIITIGTAFGLFQTEDGGITWRDIGKFPGRYILAVDIDQHHPDTIYEIDVNPVSNAFSLWKTTNGGNSWNQLSGLPPIISRVKIDPSNSNILYAATMYYGATSGYGIFKSLDGGNTWAKVVSDYHYYTDIDIQGGNPSRIYVTSDDGLHRSMDGGLNWEFIPYAKQRDVLTLALSEANPPVLFGAGYHGAFKSQDLGDTWTPINNSLYAQSIVDLAYSTSKTALFAMTLTGGLWKSTDFGASWIPLNLELNFGSFIRIDPNDPDHLFVNGRGTVFESIDGGQTWASRLFNHPFSTFVFNTNSDLFAVATNGMFGPEHVYKSSDNGNSWVETSDILPACANTCRINNLTADPSNPAILYASVYTFEDRDPPGTGQNHYLYKTNDGGGLGLGQITAPISVMDGN